MKLFKKTKLNSKGFGHLELLLVIVVVVAIAGVGLFVFKHDHKSNVAHAGSYASWKVNSQVCFPSGSCPGVGYGGYWGRINATLWACQQYIPVFGGVYQVHAHFMSAPFYYFGTNEGTYTGPYGVIPDNAARQNGTVWSPFALWGRTYYNGKDFVMNFSIWQQHYFGAVLNDGSQEIHIHVNSLPSC